MSERKKKKEKKRETFIRGERNETKIDSIRHRRIAKYLHIYISIIYKWNNASIFTRTAFNAPRKILYQVLIKSFICFA